jgi:hypothetical protein
VEEGDEKKKMSTSARRTWRGEGKKRRERERRKGYEKIANNLLVLYCE